MPKNKLTVVGIFRLRSRDSWKFSGRKYDSLSDSDFYISTQQSTVGYRLLNACFILIW